MIWNAEKKIFWTVRISQPRSGITERLYPPLHNYASRPIKLKQKLQAWRQKYQCYFFNLVSSWNLLPYWIFSMLPSSVFVDMRKLGFGEFHPISEFTTNKTGQHHSLSLFFGHVWCCTTKWGPVIVSEWTFLKYALILANHNDQLLIFIFSHT